MIEQNSSNSMEASNVAKKTVEISTLSSQQMIELEKAMMSIRDSNNDIEKLLSYMTGIMENISLLDDIVLKTKLLSFNASIEAERAGIHGRGFSHVAQEVGHLASQCGRASHEIEMIVKESQEKASYLIQENGKRVSHGAELVKNVSQSIREVIKSIEIVATKSNQVEHATQEQNRGVSQINVAISNLEREMEKISQVSDSTKDSISGLKDDAQKLEKTSKILNSIVTGNGTSNK